MKTSTRELTRAIASGDTEAFTLLYESHFDSMLREAKRYTGRDEHYCLDVVQDAMLKVIRCIRPMESEQSLRAWLRCVVKSCAYDALRRDARRIKREHARRHNHAEQDTNELERRLHWLRHQLLALDPVNRDLLLLRHRLGWTLHRIGSTLGLSAGAIDGRLTRTIRTLQEKAERDNE